MSPNFTQVRPNFTYKPSQRVGAAAVPANRGSPPGRVPAGPGQSVETAQEGRPS